MQSLKCFIIKAFRTAFNYTNINNSFTSCLEMKCGLCTLRQVDRRALNRVFRDEQSMKEKNDCRAARILCGEHCIKDKGMKIGEVGTRGQDT